MVLASSAMRSAGVLRRRAPWRGGRRLLRLLGDLGEARDRGRVGIRPGGLRRGSLQRSRGDPQGAGGPGLTVGLGDAAQPVDLAAGGEHGVRHLDGVVERMGDQPAGLAGAGDFADAPGRRGELFEQRPHRLGERHRLDPHVLGEDEVGQVVGRQRRAVGQVGGGVVRIERPTQERAHQHPVGLGGRDHEVAGVEGAAAAVFLVDEVLRRPRDLDTVRHQRGDQRLHRQRVVLVRRDDELDRRLGAAPLDRPPGLEHHVPEQQLPVPRRRVEQRPGRDPLLAHHVAERPPAALPRVDEELHRTVDLVLPPVGPELLAVDVERPGELGAGGFGEHAGDVVVVGDHVEGREPPAGVGRAGHHAVDPGTLEGVLHRRADHLVLGPDQRIDVGVDRVLVRRHVDARPVGAHLVDVEVELGDPLPVDHLGEHPGLGQVQHVGVPVVVVAGVVVVEVGQPGALVRRAAGLLRPVDHHLRAVRVEAGEEQEDGLLQDARRVRVVAGGELVGQERRHLGGRHLGRVETGADRDHCPALLHQAVNVLVRKASGVRQGPADLGQAVRPRQVLRRGDHHQKKRVAQRALPEPAHLDPVRRRPQRVVVVDQGTPGRQLAVGAEGEADHVLRPGDRPRRRCRWRGRGRRLGRRSGFPLGDGDAGRRDDPGEQGNEHGQRERGAAGHGILLERIV